MGDLAFLTLEDLQARANALADRCRNCAAIGDHTGDAAAFEQLLPVLAELERRVEACPQPVAQIDPHLGGRSA